MLCVAMETVPGISQGQFYCRILSFTTWLMNTFPKACVCVCVTHLSARQIALRVLMLVTGNIL